MQDHVSKLERRLSTFFRAFQPGNAEDRFKLIRFIVLRLPFSAERKQQAIQWASRQFGRRHKASAAAIAAAQRQWSEKGHSRLKDLLGGASRIGLLKADNPLVSFLLILRNKPELSLLAIESVAEFAGVPYELILVDNGSGQPSQALLDRIDGAEIIRNQDNVGFGPACMQAAQVARGEFLCFLNNDALLTQGAVSAALANFESAAVGAVGGKVLLADGSLQEAGSIIWSDGSAFGYGRGDDPELPQYNFRRPVDYCSAVFLITRRQLFHELGGFDPEFAPAYYEDTDYCMKLWKRSLPVIYEPQARIKHYEAATSGGVESAAVLMLAHQAKFQRKWSRELEAHYRNDPQNTIAARIAAAAPGLRIIYIDDRLPQRLLGAGFPRSNDVLRQLVKFGHHVTCASLTFPLVEDKQRDIPPEVEQFDACLSREELVQDYFPAADLVWVSRPHNLKVFTTHYPGILQKRNFVLVYDAEAIFSERMQAQSALLGKAIQPAESLEPTGPEEEFLLAKTADAVVVVSERDRETMLANGIGRVLVVGHRLPVIPSSSDFDQRSTFLFVGSIHGTENPNADSIRYFCDQIWPAIYQRTGAVLEIAGYRTDTLSTLTRDGSVRVLGAVKDLEPLYDHARVFIVPTRYAAGIPFKAHEAAAHGLPMVVSELIHKQLQWEEGSDYLVGRDAAQFADGCVRLYSDRELWSKIRSNAIKRVENELSPQVFRDAVEGVLGEAMHLASAPKAAE